MTTLDFLCLSPVLPVAVAPLIILIFVALFRNYRLTYGITLFTLILSTFFIFYIIPDLPHILNPLFVIDRFALLFLGIIYLSAILIVLLSYTFIRNLTHFNEEYYIILLTATLGAAILVVANNFVSFFLGFEVLSISLYVLISFQKTKEPAIEAGMKYLILASVSSAFMLFGMGLIYTRFGTMQFDVLSDDLAGMLQLSPMLLLGFGMMLVGLGFKLTLVPFHMWTPDVYQGAPTPISAYIATVSKGGMMAVFIRMYFMFGAYENRSFFVVISAIAILSIMFGNILAIRQKNLKRLLGYSSIANMGFVLVVLLIGNPQGINAAIFYLLSYFFATAGAFGILTLLSTHSRPVEKLKDIRGLFWKRPWLAAALTFSLFSLIGLPLTAGFMAKFYLILETVEAGILFMAFIMLAGSLISLYYYFRVVTAMFSRKIGEDEYPFPKTGFSGWLATGVILFVILYLGLFPGGVIEVLAEFLK